MGSGVSILAYPDLVANGHWWFDGLQFVVAGTTIDSGLSYINSKNSIKILLNNRKSRIMEKLKGKIGNEKRGNAK